MPPVATLFSLLLLSVTPADQGRTVKLGLLSLFKPEVVHVRIAAGEGAVLDCAGGARRVSSGDVVRIRVTGKRLNITVVDPAGNITEAITASELRLAPHASTPLELIIPGKIRREVRGQLSVSPARNALRGRMNIVLTTDLESAVASVVAAEMRGEKSAEAFKALAVVARTFMLFHSGRHAGEGFDFCDTTHCQLYRGEADLSVEAASPMAANAVASTAGEYLSFAGKPVEGFYSAVCGGLSATPEMVWGGRAASGYPYKRIVCRWCEGSRFSKWERSAPASSVLAALGDAAGCRFSRAADVRVESDGSTDFALRVVVLDGQRTVLSSDEFRSAIGRRLGWNTVLSPTFTIEKRAGAFIFRGRGFGSQAGLCEAGASAQAAAGRSYHEILKFYYPEADVAEK